MEKMVCSLDLGSDSPKMIIARDYDASQTPSDFARLCLIRHFASIKLRASAKVSVNGVPVVCVKVSRPYLSSAVNIEIENI